MGIALICDAQHNVRISLRKKLKELGFDQILECDEGESAVVTASANPLDLVILDIEMRGKNRSSAAYEIRQKLKVPMVLLTDRCDEGTVKKAKRIEAAEILVKPFEDQDLVLAIEMASAHCEEMEILKENVKDVRCAVEGKRIINKAKRILMRSEGLNALEAFRCIQKLAANKQTSMRLIAEAFLLTEGL